MLVQIDYNLNFTTPFHLGTGISTNLLDRTVIRDAGKYLYVPASTFKGVLREQCERLFLFYAPAGANSVVSPHDANAALDEFGQPPSLISRIFGSQLYPGSLRFDDARQTEKIYTEPTMQTSILTQVRIDRMTRTAVDGALYTSEFGNPFLTFSGTIKGQLNCTPIDKLETLVEDSGEVYILTPTYSLLLLLAGILMVERLGSNKSTGKGQCTCTITGLWLDRHKCSEWDVDDQPGWRSWLGSLDDVLRQYQQKGVQ
jgi:CRISPR/Cas system CSM-associated protein Csm3 (group 7 of RAMP superfamily)